MGLTEIFWLFVIFSALQPVIRQKMLEMSRLRLLTRFERKRVSRVIALVHRQETMSLLGFPPLPVYRCPRFRRGAAGHPAHGPGLSR